MHPHFHPHVFVPPVAFSLNRESVYAGVFFLLLVFSECVIVSDNIISAGCVIIVFSCCSHANQIQKESESDMRPCFFHSELASESSPIFVPIFCLTSCIYQNVFSSPKLLCLSLSLSLRSFFACHSSIFSSM